MKRFLTILMVSIFSLAMFADGSTTYKRHHLYYLQVITIKV